ASQKSVLVLEKILSLGAEADINAQESFNLTPLHIASIEGYYGCVAALLRSGALVDAQTREGNTALHVALMAESGAAIQTLVDGKADPNIFNNAGYTPLSLAAYFGYTRYVLMM
ncbi:ankyrin repeat-containing domain protein, partial [Morchella snyderi]